jgi:hypothetical protein
MPHFVKPYIDGDWTGMDFTCTEPPEANCRLQCPGLDCEEFHVEWIDGKPWHVGYKYDDETDEDTDGPLHEMSTGNPCSIIEWDALNEGYVGDRTILREGEVLFTWNDDFYEWQYVTPENAMAGVYTLMGAAIQSAIEAEQRRIVFIVEDYYKVAPKAAEKLLSLIKETEST